MNNRSEPPVTVLMPVYNAGEYLRASIEGILGQAYDNFEYLIINDGSTDDSGDIVNSYNDPRIRFIENESNLGMIATLNKGLEISSHDLIARQDADDISHPERLGRQVAFMSSNENVALLGSLAKEMDENGRPIYEARFAKPSGSTGVKWYFLFDNPFVHTSVMYRKHIILNEYGGYKLSDWCGDYDLWSRVAEKYAVAVLPEYLIKYRVHTSSLIGSLDFNSKKKEISKTENITIIKRNLDALFGKDIFSESDAKALRLFVEGVDETNCAEFMGVFDTVLSRYKNVYPESLESASFRKTIASQQSMVAYRTLTKDRLGALRLFARAITLNPGIIFSLPIVRITILMLFGDCGRALFQRLKRFTLR
ncbi:MAG TPA: glycosyltransferase [Nitrospirae bacterium]|nr:glycosyltransferase [Nitrospirota bacterium]